MTDEHAAAEERRRKQEIEWTREIMARLFERANKKYGKRAKIEWKRKTETAACDTTFTIQPKTAKFSRDTIRVCRKTGDGFYNRSSLSHICVGVEGFGSDITTRVFRRKVRSTPPKINEDGIIAAIGAMLGTVEERLKHERAAAAAVKASAKLFEPVLERFTVDDHEQYCDPKHTLRFRLKPAGGGTARVDFRARHLSNRFHAVKPGQLEDLYDAIVEFDKRVDAILGDEE